jgi:beta-glucosidase
MERALLLPAVVLAFAAAQQPPLFAPPLAPACVSPNNTVPFCDTSLDVPSRVADFLSRLTLDEKIANRYDREGPVPELGLIDTLSWNTEGLHGLGGICLTIGGTTRCPTVFAAPPGLGASWNLTLLNSIGGAIGTELRAMNNNGGNRDYQNRPLDLNVWLPNINLQLDPR